MSADVRAYYPAMLDLRGRRAVVIGGGKIAARKIDELLASGARVAVVAPKPCAHVDALDAQKTVKLYRRAYCDGDLAGAIIAVTATNDAHTQERAWREAQRRGIFVNTVDEVDRCSFITPSILRRGTLTIAVSTAGTNPGLAKRIRQRLETLFPKHFGHFLEIAGHARKKLRENGIDYATRDRFADDIFKSGAADLIANIAAKYIDMYASKTLYEGARSSPIGPDKT